LQKRRLEEVSLDPQWGNVEVDPGFVNPQNQDFVLAADSPARKASIGAADPIALASPWPTQPGEESCASPPEQTKPLNAATNIVMADTASRVDVAAMVRDIQQRKDPALRERSLDRLQSLLSSKASAEEQTGGLMVLRQVLTVRFDRDRFRPLVVSILKTENGSGRALALACLPALNPTADDLALIVPMVNDASPKIRAAAGTALILIGQGKHADQVIPALMKVLQDLDSEVVTQVIRSMWGQYTSPEFDELLIKLSRNEQYHHIVVYHTLSTMQHKSVAVCQRLVEELDDPDWNNSGRAAWGLTYGVIDEAKSIVEEGLLAALPEETNDYTRGQEFRALRNVATEKSRTYLQSVLDNELETDDHRNMAREILKGLEQKR
jgi:hypothetical protein